MNVLNSKERKRILQQLEQQYGCDITTLKKYEILYNDVKKKFYFLASDVLEFPLDKIKIDAIGLYIGQLMTSGEIRLSIEGSQLIGKTATKGILHLNKEQAALWSKGEDLELRTEETGFLIITNGKDFIGCGKPVTNEKHTLLHNYIPKTRYVAG